jgi:transposase-like protein
MRYPASEKLEIIRIVEQSHLPAKRTLDQLGIARRTFYRWYDRYLEGGPEALEGSAIGAEPGVEPHPADIQDQIIEMALEQSELAPANWRCASPTRSATSCRKPRFTACSRPMI